MTRSLAKWALLRLLLITVAYFAAAGVRPARADNLADEAELEFELGAERYKAGDFRGALEHFLASNRLVPNRNVVFNIARTYEQLKQSADAYRYFSQALEGETDEPTRARINEALTRTLPQVAVVHIESDPPGATVYVGRRELGPRGNAPLVLGLAPGNYKIMADLPGYESAELPAQDFAAGTKKDVKWALKQIVGNLKVDGSPQGAAVRLDDEGGKVLCSRCPARPTCRPAATPSSSRRRATSPSAVTATVVAGAAAASRVDLTGPHPDAARHVGSDRRARHRRRQAAGVHARGARRRRSDRTRSWSPSRATARSRRRSSSPAKVRRGSTPT